MSSTGGLTIRELLDALAAIPVVADVTDPEQYRERIYQELAEHRDPLLREIGEQLRDGSVRPHQLFAIPAYAEVLRQGLENLRHVDPNAIRESVVHLLESSQQKPDPEE